MALRQEILAVQNTQTGSKVRSRGKPVLELSASHSRANSLGFTERVGFRRTPLRCNVRTALMIPDSHAASLSLEEKRSEAD